MNSLKSSPIRRTPGSVKRTSISYPAPLHSKAIHIVDREGFGTFSGYVEFLIRLDVERRSHSRA